MRYAAVVCPRCGRASAARADARGHTCPYCGFRMPVEGSAVIYMGDARSVREAVRRYNERRGGLL